MGLPLVYEISTTGEERVRSVLRGIEREQVASDRRISQSRRSSARAGGDPMYGPGRAEAGRAAVQRHREEMRAAAAKSREAAAAMRREQAEKTRAAVASNRAARQEQTERNKAFRERERQVKWEARQQVSAEQRVRRRADIETRAAERTRRATAATLARGAATSIRGAVGTVLGTGGAILGAAGSFAAAGAMRSQMSAQAQASALANQAGMPGNKAELLAESGRVKGFTQEETLSAMGEFVGKTGDLSAARAIIDELGQQTLALGADFSEMGQVAGQVFNGLADAITDPNERIVALKKVLRGWGGMGNIGTVEMKDLAQYGGRLGAASRKFSGDPATLMLRLGAIAEASAQRGGSVDAAEATTAVGRFAADLTKHPAQKAMHKLGIDPFADKGGTILKDPGEIMADILEKTKGNLPLIEEILNAESGKAVGGFAPLFLQAEGEAQKSAKANGTKYKYGVAGRAAVMGEFDRYTSAALTDKDVKERAQSRLEDPDLQFKATVKEFNESVGKVLLPVATDVAREFKDLIPEIAATAQVAARFVRFLVENPLAGTGALVAGLVAKDILMAGIGKGAERAIVSALSFIGGKRPAVGGAGTVGPGGTPSEGGTDVLGAVTAGATIGLTVATAIITVGLANFERSEAITEQAGRGLNAARAATDPETVKAELARQRKVLSKEETPGVMATLLGKGAQGLGAVLNALGIGEKLTEQEYLQGGRSALDVGGSHDVIIDTLKANIAELEAKMKELSDAAEMHKQAASALEKAAGSITAASGARRSDPIVSPGRG